MEKSQGTRLNRTDRTSPMRRPFFLGFTLLEFQLGILMFALAMTGLARVMSLQGAQTQICEQTAAAAGASPTATTAGLHSMETEETMNPSGTTAGQYEVDIQSLQRTTATSTGPQTYVATVMLRTATTTDVGY